jgi:hypothetical protein
MTNPFKNQISLTPCVDPSANEKRREAGASLGKSPPTSLAPTARALRATAACRYKGAMRGNLFPISVLVVGIGLAAASCTSKEDDLVTKAKDVVLKTLRDPTSAQFEKIGSKTAKDYNGDILKIVCGLVNSKNGFGGYVGFRPFAYFDNTNELVLVSNLTPQGHLESVRMYCPEVWSDWSSHSKL